MSKSIWDFTNDISKQLKHLHGQSLQQTTNALNSIGSNELNAIGQFSANFSKPLKHLTVPELQQLSCALNPIGIKNLDILGRFSTDISNISEQTKCLSGLSLQQVVKKLNSVGRKDLRALERFHTKLKEKMRFFCEHEFLDILKKAFDRFTIFINADEVLYRARRLPLDYDEDKWKHSDPFMGYNKEKSFIPPAKETTAGRANMRGIPCLYAARSAETAVSEVRPFKGTHVSVAEIRIKKELRLFSFYITNDDYMLDLADFIGKFPAWYRRLAITFSIPRENSENDEYLLTQCISEYLWLHGGFDGIAFPSSLHDRGENIVLFNCKHNSYDICEPVSSSVYRIKDIKVEYEHTF